MQNGEPPKRDLRGRTFKFARPVIKPFVSLTRSQAGFMAKSGDCLKEADEPAYWLELMAAEQVGAPADVAPALDEASQLVAILTTIKRRAEGKD